LNYLQIFYNVIPIDSSVTVAVTKQLFSLYHLKDPRDIKRLSFLQLFPEFSPSYRNEEKKQTDSENSIHAIDDMKSDRYSQSDKVTDLSRPFLFPQSRQL